MYAVHERKHGQLPEICRNFVGASTDQDAIIATLKGTFPVHSRRKTTQGKCFKCNKRGHIAKDCKSNKASGSNETAATVKTAEAVFKTTEKAPWMIDSGATTHLTGDRTALRKQDVTQQVTFADGSTRVLTGARGFTDVGIKGALKLDSVLYSPDISTCQHQGWMTPTIPSCRRTGR